VIGCASLWNNWLRDTASQYNGYMEQSTKVRVNALAQLKKAQAMIHEGRRELAAANKKIRVALKLIDDSADALRGSRTDLPHGARPR
jgi:hypothetical protein